MLLPGAIFSFLKAFGSLETLLVVRAGRGSPAGLEWVESPESAGHPRAHRGPPAWPLQSSMLRRSGEPWCASPNFPGAFYLLLPSVSTTFSPQLAPWTLVPSTWTFPQLKTCCNLWTSLAPFWSLVGCPLEGIFTFPGASQDPDAPALCGHQRYDRVPVSLKVLSLRTFVWEQLRWYYPPLLFLEHKNMYKPWRVKFLNACQNFKNIYFCLPNFTGKNLSHYQPWKMTPNQGYSLYCLFNSKMLGTT